MSTDSTATAASPAATVAAIALGGNQGDVPTAMRRALSILEDSPTIRVMQVSRLFRTVPIGMQAGGAYVNAAAMVRTTLTPPDLLDRLQETEKRCGRVRTVHWGPRTLDLDLIRYDDVVLDTRRLTLPHPACWYRRFVLDPWCDVDPNWIHPHTGESVREMRQLLTQRPLPVTIPADDVAAHHALIQDLRNRFPAEHVDFRTTHSSPVLRLCLAPELPALPRSIPLRQADSPIELAAMVLSAALDEPAPLEAPGFEPSNPASETKHELPGHLPLRLHDPESAST